MDCAMTSPAEVSAECRQRAHDTYFHHPSITVAEIAALVGVSVSTFNRQRKVWGWPARREVLAELAKSGRAVSHRPAPQADAAETSLREAAQSLAQATRQQIKALVKAQRAGQDPDPAKTAQALASYAKTLTTAQALLKQEGSTLDDSEHREDSRRSIHDLRDELAHHLERIIAEEEARGSDGLLV
jgi:DNA-binding protein H-NS